MSINRAWLRRGLTNPAPWARSVPTVWMESIVAFRRSVPLADTGGNFSAPPTPPAVYLTANAHVEFDDWQDKTSDTQRRIARVYMPLPLDPRLMPQHGDIMEWTDDLGTAYRTHVRTIESPLNMNDHLEIESEAFL